MRSQVHDLVTVTAGIHPDRPALTFRDDTVPYSELARRVRAVGAGLARLGVARDDRVAIYLDKRIETVLAMFGTSAASGVFVPVNPVLRAPQVGHILRDSGARCLVTTADRLATLAPLLAECAELAYVVLVDGDAVPVPGAGWAATPWPALEEPEPGGTAPGAVTESDVAAILYTSGSTGLPKGVVLSHRNVVVGAESVSAYLRNTSDDVILSALPLSFDAGMSQLTTAFAVGAHVVLHNYVLPRDVVRLCARHRVTGLTCVPPLWIQIAEQEWPAEAAGSLRYFANTGGRMPKSTLDRLRAVFPQAEPFLMYGLTEAFRSTYLDPAQVDRRPDSIGRAIPNAEVLVLRPDGTECDPGEHGELVHRGPLVALGYWRDPERTAARFRPVPPRPDGVPRPELAVWSGDVVVRDDEGYLYFVGRNDEMIKTSGYRVSPTEIEELAYATGMVRDAVALGAQDEVLGQHIVLVVAAHPGTRLDEAELVAAYRRSAPLYMVPRTVLVRDELPRSPNGKFDRTRLRQEVLGA